MYTIIISAIIGFLFIIVIEITDSFKRKYHSFDWEVLIFAIPHAVLGAFIGLLIAISLPQKYSQQKWSSNIISLKDNSSLNGSFFLGCGQINGTMRYVYYEENTDSTYKLQMVDYNNATIKYTSNKPRINVTDVRPSESIWNKFAIDIIDESTQSYIIEIPEGTIKNNYELDSQ